MFVSLGSTLAQDFDIEGHRGCRGLMPENSIEGFLKAIDLGVTTVEMDVVVSADGQIVVSHDHYFSSDFCVNEVGLPISKKKEKNILLYRMDYEDIKLFDCGIKGNPDFPEQQKISTYKPLLNEVIERCEEYIKDNGKQYIQYNIELKSSKSGDNIRHPNPEVFTRLVHETIENIIEPARVIIQSFDPRILQFWRMRYPDYRISYLTSRGKTPDKVSEELGFKPDIYSPHYKTLKKQIVDEFHAQSIAVVPWTINKVSEMKKVIDMGIDGLITDYPNRYFDSVVSN
jgi:glycerophosphoryl diester phosphodiesterase